MSDTQKNTTDTWDHKWNEPGSTGADRINLMNEENGVRWQHIEKIVADNYGSFEGLDVIEIGAGMGTNAALMARRGAKVTLLDFSPVALERARIFFERNGVKAKMINCDALSLSPDAIGKYDVSMSFGLAEHFKGGDRLKIVMAHFDVLKNGGISFVSVPNRYNPPYRIYKFIAETAMPHTWTEEYPFSRRELKRICGQIGIKDYSFFGDSFLTSFDTFLSPVIRKVMTGDGRRRADKIRKKERGIVLDQYLSYALVLCAKKSK